MVRRKDKIDKNKYNSYKVGGTIPSPCDGTCSYGDYGDYNNFNLEDICIGCYRSIDEITGWTYYSDKQRQEVIDEALKRKNKVLEFNKKSKKKKLAYAIINPMSTDTDKNVVLYTASYRTRSSKYPKRSAWGTVTIHKGEVTEDKHVIDDNTDDIDAVDLLALITNVENATKKYPNTPIAIYTNSSYAQKGITLYVREWVENDWKTEHGKGHEVKHRHHWEKLIELDKNNQIAWLWAAKNDQTPEMVKAYDIARDALGLDDNSEDEPKETE